jgi:hypothetical protein
LEYTPDNNGQGENKTEIPSRAQIASLSSPLDTATAPDTSQQWAAETNASHPLMIEISL